MADWHVTEENPTHHVDQCGETEPFTRRDYHMCCLTAGHEGEHECRACDATWVDSW